MDTILSGSCNIRWPDGNYALPMSVYGCPEPDMASWKYGYINISFTERTDLYEKTLGSIGWNHSFLMLLGPYGPYSYQLNFCMKDPASSTIASTDTPMWPPGKYSIIGTAAGCPEGRDILILCRQVILNGCISATKEHLAFLSTTNHFIIVILRK